MCTTVVVDDAISWACLSTFATVALEAVAAAGRIPRGSIRAHAAGVNVPYLSAYTYTHTHTHLTPLSLYYSVTHTRTHQRICTHTHTHRLYSAHITT